MFLEISTRKHSESCQRNSKEEVEKMIAELTEIMIEKLGVAIPENEREFDLDVNPSCSMEIFRCLEVGKYDGVRMMDDCTYESLMRVSWKWKGPGSKRDGLADFFPYKK